MFLFLVNRFAEISFMSCCFVVTLIISTKIFSHIVSVFLEEIITSIHKSSLMGIFYHGFLFGIQQFSIYAMDLAIAYRLSIKDIAKWLLFWIFIDSVLLMFTFGRISFFEISLISILHVSAGFAFYRILSIKSPIIEDMGIYLQHNYPRLFFLTFFLNFVKILAPYNILFIAAICASSVRIGVLLSKIHSICDAGNQIETYEDEVHVIISTSLAMYVVITYTLSILY